MVEKGKEQKEIMENEEQILVNLHWEIDRKTAHIRSFENRLLTALGIDSVVVGLLVTFYSLNPTIAFYELCLFITFGILLLLILAIQLHSWWPRKASERENDIELEKRIDLGDLNKQLNTLDSTLKCRARLVYVGLVSFAIQIILLLTIILIRII